MKLSKMMKTVLVGVMVFLMASSTVPVNAEGNVVEALRPNGVISKLPSVAATTWAELKTGIENAAEDTEITISGTITRAYNDATITIPAGIAITLNCSNEAKLYYDGASITNDGFIIPDTSSLKLAGALSVEAKNYTSGRNDAGILTLANAFKIQSGGSFVIDGALSAHTSYSMRNGDYGKKSFIDSEGIVSITANGSVSGWTVYGSGFSAALLIHGTSGSLTLDGGTVSGCTEHTSNISNGSAIQIRDGASFVMNSGSITGNGVFALDQDNMQEKGAGVYVEGTDSIFTMNGGSITGNIATQGAGVAVENGATFNMTAGTISDNQFCNSNYGGGAVSVNNAAFNMSGTSVISGNKFFDPIKEGYSVQTKGAGVLVEGANATFSMDGGTIKDNASDDAGNKGGGGVYFEGKTAILKNGSITGNSAGDKHYTSGGGIYISSGDVTLENMEIKNNSASVNVNKPSYQGDRAFGGGVVFVSGGTLTITNCTIENNAAGTDGGGMFAQGGTIIMTGGTIADNTLADNPVSLNRNLQSGAGICLSGSNATFTGVTISGNQMKAFASGIYVEGNSSDVVFKDCIITGNEAADNNAGGVGAVGGTVTLKGTTKVSGNIANQGGQGVYVGTGATFKIQDTVKIAGDNDVALESGAVITVSDDFTGASYASPISITSADEQVETDTVAGTPLVVYTAEAGGEAEAKKASLGKYFIPSAFMTAGLNIGQSAIAGNTDHLTYVANAVPDPTPDPVPETEPSGDNDPLYLVTFLDCQGNTVKVEWVKYDASATAPAGYGIYSGFANVTSHRDLRPLSCKVSDGYAVPNTSDKTF